MPHQRGRAEDVEDLAELLFDRVRQLRREAGRTAATSAHAVAFAKEVFEHRGEYVDALKTLERVETDSLHDLFLTEVGRAYARRQSRIAGVQLRSELLVEWIAVLVDSLAAVQATLAEGPIPFHQLLDDDDLAIMAEDRRLDGDLGARGISEAWQA